MPAALRDLVSLWQFGTVGHCQVDQREFLILHLAQFVCLAAFYPPADITRFF